MTNDAHREASCPSLRRLGLRAAALGLALSALPACDEEQPAGLVELTDVEEAIYELTSVTVNEDSCQGPGPEAHEDWRYGVTVFRETDAGPILHMIGCRSVEDCRDSYEAVLAGQFPSSPIDGVFEDVDDDGVAWGTTVGSFEDTAQCNRQATMFEMRVAGDEIRVQRKELERVYFDADPEHSCDSDEGLEMATTAPCETLTVVEGQLLETLR